MISTLECKPAVKQPEPQWMAAVLCVSCGHRWFRAITAKDGLFTLPCMSPECGRQTSFAQILPKSYGEAMLRQAADAATRKVDPPAGRPVIGEITYVEPN